MQVYLSTLQEARFHANLKIVTMTINDRIQIKEIEQAAKHD